MDGVHMTGASLLNVRLTSCPLTNAILDKASLVGLIMKDWDLSNSSLVGATLRGSSLTGCSLKGANLSHCDMSECVGLTNAHLREARHEMTGIQLQGVDIKGWDLSELDLTGSNLSGADLRECNMSGTCLKRSLLIGTRFCRGYEIRSALIPSVLWKGVHWYQEVGYGNTHNVSMAAEDSVSAEDFYSAVKRILGFRRDQFESEDSYTIYLIECMHGIAGLSTIPANMPLLLSSTAEDFYNRVRKVQSDSVTIPLLDTLTGVVRNGGFRTPSGERAYSHLLQRLTECVKHIAGLEVTLRDHQTPETCDPDTEDILAKYENALSKAVSAVVSTYREEETDPLTLWMVRLGRPLVDALVWLLRRETNATATLRNLEAFKSVAYILSDTWRPIESLLPVLTGIVRNHSTSVPVMITLQQIYINYNERESETDEREFAMTFCGAFHRMSANTADMVSLLEGTRFYVTGSMPFPYTDITGRALVQQLSSIVTDTPLHTGPGVLQSNRSLPPVVKLCVECVSQYFCRYGLPAAVASQVIETVFAVRHQYPTDRDTLKAVVSVCGGVVMGDTPRTDYDWPPEGESPEMLLSLCEPNYIQMVLPLFHGTTEEDIAARYSEGNGESCLKVLGVNAVVRAYQADVDTFVETQMGPALEAGLLESLFCMLECTPREHSSNRTSDSTAVGVAELCICAMGHAPAGWRDSVTQAQRDTVRRFHDRWESEFEAARKPHLRAMLMREIQAEWEDTERGSNPQTVLVYLNHIVEVCMTSDILFQRVTREYVAARTGTDYDQVAFGVAWNRMVAVGAISAPNGDDVFTFDM
ncbi:hypothetical protein KIPB_004960 [Kipferlia bialata]|uniref:Uncharacterized protein n=1 Tax=Kipferlia bialata TaxID=797122 RepID=A0A9K3GIK3_9EUKA|nr:hypothetical protein KIPB_004960 [Kipferlia bialata]|eukprot:g4960.t1